MVKKKLCNQPLNAEDLVTLRNAVEDLYYAEFVIGMWPVTANDNCIP